MVNYHEIKEKELITTEGYSERKFNRYLKSHRILLSLTNEKFFWFISFVPFAIFSFFSGAHLFFLFVHFLYWILYGKRKSQEFCEKDVEELEIAIWVLEDIKKEKYSDCVKATEERI